MSVNASGIVVPFSIKPGWVIESGDRAIHVCDGCGVEWLDPRDPGDPPDSGHTVLDCLRALAQHTGCGNQLAVERERPLVYPHQEVPAVDPDAPVTIHACDLKRGDVYKIRVAGESREWTARVDAVDLGEKVGVNITWLANGREWHFQYDMTMPIRLIRREG